MKQVQSVLSRYAYGEILLALLSVQGIFLLSLLSKVADGTIGSPQSVCWYFWQNCSAFLYVPSPGTSASLIFFGTLILFYVGACVCAFNKKWFTYGAVLFAIPSVWIALHVLVFSYSAGHAYDYAFLILAALYLCAKRDMQFEAVALGVVAMHFVSALYMMTLFVSGFASVGRPVDGSIAILGDLLRIAPVVLGLLFSVFVFDYSRTQRRYFIGVVIAVYVYASLTLLLESRYALIIVPHLLLMLISPVTVHIKKITTALLVVACLFVGGQLFQGYRTVVHGALCLRPHVGIATAYTQAQCVSVVSWTSMHGEAQYNSFKSPIARPCWCDPYVRWYKAKQQCARAKASPLAWSLYTSVRGGVAERVAHTEDLCSTQYPVLSKPSWLQ